MKFLTKLGLLMSGLWLVAVSAVVGTSWPDIGCLGLNEWGDFLAGVSAPLALFWLVIGYFQQGQELQLNTDALRAQQEELRRQVEETALLAQNAERQAAATEALAELNESEQRARSQKETLASLPRILAEGGSLTSSLIKTDLVNRGGEVSEVKLIYDGPYDLRLSSGPNWQEGQRALLVLKQTSRDPITYPIDFAIAFTTRLGESRKVLLRMPKAHVVVEIDRSQAADD
ncbi:MAG: hypothetical protein AAF265_05685 [Pseudomonadota bacterium]